MGAEPGPGWGEVLKIAFLTHEPFYPPSGGGSAEAVYLVQELVRRGHHVRVYGPPVENPDQVCRDFRIDLAPFGLWRMGRYARFRTLKYLAYPLALERHVLRASAGTRFDLVLSQHAISSVAAGRLKRKLQVPVVMNYLDYLTGFMETWPRWKMPSAVLSLLKRFELETPQRYHADGVMTVSDVLADLFAARGYPRERLRPIYYGYDADLFRWKPGQPFALDEAPVVVMHGSLDHHHLGRVAVDAVARVSGSRPETRFRFVGKETDALRSFRDRLRVAAPRAVVECTGFVPYAQVAEHLSRASVGMVPYEESAGTHCAFVAKMVEYLGIGLPVASTPLESVRRYFADEPLARFSRFEGKELGEVILGWLAEPPGRRQELGPVASERVRQALDWRVLCSRAVDFVEKVAGTWAAVDRSAGTHCT